MNGGPSRVLFMIDSLGSGGAEQTLVRLVPRLDSTAFDTRVAVLVFGLIHGFGLATKLQDFALPRAGLAPKIVAFNAGVEIGQLLALSAILAVMVHWRRTASFGRHAWAANVALMSAGFVLMGVQLTGYFILG